MPTEGTPTSSIYPFENLLHQNGIYVYLWLYFSCRKKTCFSCLSHWFISVCAIIGIVGNIQTAPLRKKAPEPKWFTDDELMLRLTKRVSTPYIRTHKYFCLIRNNTFCEANCTRFARTQTHTHTYARTHTQTHTHTYTHTYTHTHTRWIPIRSSASWQKSGRQRKLSLF